jgi:probable HAF family extracellular repeat protein
VVHAFLLKDGDITSFDFPGATFTAAFGINPGSDIVGRYIDAGGVARGYLLSQGQITTIDFPGAVFTDATAINTKGDVLGRYRSADGVFHGFLLSRQERHEGRYTVTDLGTLPGGTFSQATFVNDDGLVSGLATVPDGTQHAVLWYRGRIMDIAKPGLGGPNSGAFGVNERGQAVVQAETSTKDPNSENFCGYGTGLNCLPALWQNGRMTPLPTLGGNNGTVGQINNRGEVAGIAENGIRDPECTPGVAVNGTGPQALDFEAVIWGPRQGEIRELRRLPGDSVGMALWINDNGQAVGSSGSCANTVLPPFAAGPHAVLWEKDGSVTDLGNLGGTANPALLAVGNIAFSINNRGQVVGASALPGDAAVHAFLWTRERGMRDLGTLPGDVNSAGLGINDRGEVVGASINGSAANGNPRAVLWKKGVPIDLNTLIPPNSPLYLLTAVGINDVGEVVGFGVTSTGDIHGFLAIPIHGEDEIDTLLSDANRPDGRAKTQW